MGIGGRGSKEARFGAQWSEVSAQIGLVSMLADH